MKLKGRNKVSPEFSMSSMTDIVFLLLVFFMLTSSVPNALDLLLPKAKGKSTNVQNVSVSINKKLKDQETPTIILRAEEGVPIEKAVDVMDIANRNNYKVILAVRPK